MACGTEKILDNVIRVACLTTSGHVSADLRWLAPHTLLPRRKRTVPYVARRCCAVCESTASICVWLSVAVPRNRTLPHRVSHTWRDRSYKQFAQSCHGNWTSWRPSIPFGNSLEPTIVRFMPICTLTHFSPTLTFVFPFKYHPSEPVENSLTSAVIGIPLIVISTGLASLRNSERVTEHVDLAIQSSFEAE